MRSEYKKNLRKIKAFVFDVDGVLTNGELYVFPGGKLVRKMNAKDGYVLKLALEKGYQIAIITGGREKEIKSRLQKLGIENIFLNTHHKLPVLKKFIEENNLKTEEILYMGDDIPDIESLMHVGLSCCPNNAVNDVKKICDYISHKNGGDGCVRDIVEQTLRATENWDLNGEIKY